MIQLNNIRKSFNDVEVIRYWFICWTSEVVTLIVDLVQVKQRPARMINALEIPIEITVYISSKTYTSKDKNHK